MRKKLLGFSIALAVLIVTVSVWVIFNAIRDEITNRQTTTVEDTESFASTKIENKSFDDRMATGESLLADNYFERAAAEFAAAAQLEVSATEPLILLAETQIRLEEFAKARANLSAAEQLDALNPDIFILRGIIFLREENFTEAEKSFAKAAESGKFWRGVMAAFFDRSEEAQNFLNASNDARATEIITAYEEYAIYPDSPKTHLDTLLTRAFLQIGEYELALAKIGPVLEDDADYRDAWLLTGYAQFAKKNFELAKQSWQTAYALDPTKPETQYFLGCVNFELRDFAEAEKYFLLTKENRLQASDLNEKLAETYFEQGKYRAAADLISQELAKNPTLTVEEFTRPISIYLEKLGDGRNAWNLANLARTRFPESAFAHNLAGWVSLSNDYLAEAREQLEKSIQLDPGLPWPYFNLGRYFEKMESPASALAAYREAFELDTNGAIGVLAAENYNRLLAEINPPPSE